MGWWIRVEGDRLLGNGVYVGEYGRIDGQMVGSILRRRLGVESEWMGGVKEWGEGNRERWVGIGIV